MNDIIVIGGGAAGLMAAIAAAQGRTAKVAILERMDGCGKKILISGGGRCNLSNSSLSAENYSGGSRNFIRNVLAAFGKREAVRFFESLGIKIVEEDEGRLFPDKGARQLLSALLERADESRVQIFTGCRIDKIISSKVGFEIRAGSRRFNAARVILACGGSACPACGTDGSGYALASSLGHSIVEPSPALAPIDLKEPALGRLAGISIDAELALCEGDRTTARSRGSVLVTHSGISGPAALNLSRHAARAARADASLLLNALPEHTAASLGCEIREWMRLHPKAEVITRFKDLLPDRFCEFVLRRAGIDPSKRLGHLSRHDIEAAASAFTHIALSLRGVQGFSAAHVTAGGIPLTEVRYQTMESRAAKGLYLAGEILDADGMTGGYNFQWAWSTGFIAGRAASGSGKRIS